MARGRKPKWIKEKTRDGVLTYTLSSWKYFHDFIQENLLDNKNYVFRGQRNENWKLEPSLHRIFSSTSDKDYSKKMKKHLDNFKYSIRGRANFIKDIIENDNELWAVGQHNFLATPLLDFSHSPYVAAYFAFYEKENETDYRAIYALSQSHVKNELTEELELYSPLSGHNPRLLTQSGLFVNVKSKNHIEASINNYFTSNPSAKKFIKLYKIRIPNKERKISLLALNKMNINHNSLFPDLFGASIFCNTSLEIDKY